MFYQINTTFFMMLIIINMMSQEKQHKHQCIQLEIPQVSRCRLEVIHSKIKPFREGGLRLEHQQIQGKHIFHNYGHGSSGIALAYGSAFMSVKSLSTYLREEEVRSCAVLGSGLIGLLTANELAKKGLSATVYSKDSSVKNRKLYSCKENDGLFLPFGYDSSVQKLAGINLSGRRQFMTETGVIPPFLYNGYKHINIDYQNGKIEDYTKLKTIKINLPLFLEELRVEAQLRGVKFTSRVFTNQDQVTGLQESCIFNCTGCLKAKFEHTIALTNPKKLNFTLITSLQHKDRVRICCEGHSIQIRSQNLTQIENLKKDYPKQLLSSLFNFTTERSQNQQSKL